MSRKTRRKIISLATFGNFGTKVMPNPNVLCLTFLRCTHITKLLSNFLPPFPPALERYIGLQCLTTAKTPQSSTFGCSSKCPPTQLGQSQTLLLEFLPRYDPRWSATLPCQSDPDDLHARTYLHRTFRPSLFALFRNPISICSSRASISPGWSRSRSSPSGPKISISC